MKIIKDTRTIKVKDFIDFNKFIELPTGDIIKIKKRDIYGYDKVNGRSHCKIKLLFEPADFIREENPIFVFPKLWIKFRNQWYQLNDFYAIPQPVLEYIEKKYDAKLLYKHTLEELAIDLAIAKQGESSTYKLVKNEYIKTRVYGEIKRMIDTSEWI